MIKRLMKMELYQLTHSRMFYMVLVICSLISLLFTSEDFLSEPIVKNTPNNIMGIYMNALADVGIALIVITGCYSVYLFGEQFKQRTIALKIGCGYGRIIVYLVQCIRTFLVVGFIISFSTFIGCFKYGVGSFIKSVAANLEYFIRTLGFIFLLSFSIVSFCLILTVIFQDTSKALIASFIFLFISCYIMAALVFENLTTGSLDSAYEVGKGAIMKFYPPYLWRWSLNPDLDTGNLVMTIFISLLWGGVAFTSGCYVFCRREIK